MEKERGSTSAQSSIEFLILAGIVMILLIPLFYYTTGNVDTIREQRIAEGAQSVKNAVSTLLELGEKSKTVEIITNPSGIEGYTIQGNALHILFQGYNVSTIFPIPIYGLSKWPITEGTHRINIYNEGEYIVFAECGNGIIEAFEQCDIMPTCPGGTCIAPGQEDECKCTCTTDAQCPSGYECESGVVCEPIDKCPPSTTWVNGKCCTDSDVDTYFVENGVCGLPLDCDDNNAAINPGATEICNDGVDNDCDNQLDCADPDCSGVGTCPVGPSGPTCGDGIVNQLTEECDDGNGNEADLCTSSCTWTTCGDGILQEPNGEGLWGPLGDGFEECDDGNLLFNDGCTAACQIELLWSLSPNPVFIGNPVAHTLNTNVFNYLTAYHATGIPTSTIVKICDQTGCDGVGNCVGAQTCSFNVASGQSSCTASAPMIPNTYPRFACLWYKATMQVLVVQGPPGPTCGDGTCSPGETCPADCIPPIVCGDGSCGAGENCCADCGCPGGEQCISGTCQPTGGGGGCTPSCGSAVCGPDPICGTSCGTCLPGEICTNGFCVGDPGFCGDGQLDPGEECEVPTDCPDQSGMAESCVSCTCAYTPFGGGGGKPFDL